MKYTNQKVRCLTKWCNEVENLVTIGKIYDFPNITWDNGNTDSLFESRESWIGIFDFENIIENYEIY